MEDAAKLAGRVLGGYRLVGEIGRGGMGTVYRAEAPDGAAVALKVLDPRHARKPVIRQRFLQEAALAGRLDHPNLVRCLGAGEDAGFLYLAMELVEGETLSAYIERVGPLPEKTALRLVVGVARALQKAHQEGLVHRDVKPENVLLSHHGHVKLADLGLAKDLESDAQLTRADAGIGTPASMAPEQFRDAAAVTARCDIYGLGYILYVMLTGRLPFGVGTQVDLFMRKLVEQYPRPAEVVPELSPRVARTIELALSAEPTKRPESARQFVAFLLGESPPPGLPAPPTAAAPDVSALAAAADRTASLRQAKLDRDAIDSAEELARLVRRAKPAAPATAVRDELAAERCVWLEPGTLPRLAAAGAGALALLALAAWAWRAWR